MMTTQEQYIAKIKQLVVQRFGSNITSADDCVALSDAVERAVGVRIDMPTLQMLFSRNSRVVMPRPMVLSALSKYVGYTGWSDFCTTCKVDASDSNITIPVRRRWGVIIATAVLFVVVVAGVVMLLGRGGSEEQGSVAPTPYDYVVEDVEEMWLARTEGHYVSLRVYDGANSLAFDRYVAEFTEEFCADLEAFIANDIRTRALVEEVSVEGRDVDASAKAIATKCIAILDELKP